MRRTTGRNLVWVSGMLLGLTVALSRVACSSEAPPPAAEPRAETPGEPTATVPEMPAVETPSGETPTEPAPAAPVAEPSPPDVAAPSEATGPEAAVPKEEAVAPEAADVAPAGPSEQPPSAPADVATPAPPQPAPTQAAYVGSQACKKCHFAQFQSWQGTRMAKAFDSLKPGERSEAKVAAGLDPALDYTTDAHCLPCHTVGYGKPGGFTSLAQTPDLAGVGCESCHGPGGDYLEIMTLKYKDHPIAEMTEKGLVYPPREATCVECHNAEAHFNASVDPKYAFNFEERVRLEEGSHAHRPLKGSHPDLADLDPIFQEAP